MNGMITIYISFLLLELNLLKADDFKVWSYGISNSSLNFLVLLPFHPSIRDPSNKTINYQFEEWNSATGFNYVPGSVLYALSEIERDSGRYRNIRKSGLGFYIADTQCLSDRSLLAFWNVFLDNLNANIKFNIHGIIGPVCLESCKQIAKVAREFHIPVITWSCSELNDEERSQVFLSVAEDVQQTSETVAKLTIDFEWENLGIIGNKLFSANEYKESIEESCKYSGKDVNVYVSQVQKSLPPIKGLLVLNESSQLREYAEQEEIETNLFNLLSKTNVIFVYMKKRESVHRFLHIFRDSGLTVAGVQVILFGLSSDLLEYPEKNRHLLKILEGQIVILSDRRQQSTWKDIDNFHKKVKELSENSSFSFRDRIDPITDVNIKYIEKQAYESAMLLAGAYEAVANGKTRDLVFTNQKLTLKYSTFFSDGRRLRLLKDKNGEYNQALFSGYRQFPSPDVHCRFLRNCTQSDKQRKSYRLSLWIFTALILGIVIIWLMKRFVEDQSWYGISSWLLRSADLFFIEKDEQNSITKSSNSDISSLINSSEDLKRYTDIATSEKFGMLVVKPLNKNFDLNNKKILQELKLVKNIEHENINPYRGVCIDYRYPCLLLDYCSRGSLHTVFKNSRFKLDSTFELSFSIDICKGLDYLHNSPINFHGRLKSENCVVDTRWTVKITDFGLDYIRTNYLISEKDHFIEGIKRFWQSPEQLRGKKPKGSKEGDIYSFGIILLEIITRKYPFYLEREYMRPKQIIAAIIDKKRTPKFRPKIVEKFQNTHKLITEIITKCWKELPKERPSLKALSQELRDMVQGKEISLIDNVTKEMDAYQDSLEDELFKAHKRLEYAKSDTLDKIQYYSPRDLVKKFAESINPKIPVYQEQECSICFIEIHRFHEEFESMNANKLIELLQDLHKRIDRLLSKNDKVDRIYHSCYVYLLVSGLICPNTNHALDIARVAISLRNSLNERPILEDQSYEIKLNIGIHSGELVGCMTGGKMDKFMVFGDAVHIARQLQKKCSPGSILVSEPTNGLLRKVGLFTTIPGPTVTIENQYTMTSYELIKKFGYLRKRETETFESFPFGRLMQARCGGRVSKAQTNSKSSQFLSIPDISPNISTLNKQIQPNDSDRDDKNHKKNIAFQAVERNNEKILKNRLLKETNRFVRLSKI
ncbi:DgyrCDS7907 [Dimorphilus gyrociliatus]|uniref:guanylate cyclase n=1 Tax=Dimorphilus gyrociliatus TaxID=2664684 RepID=A0A7I8VSJ0_9ANNE|nr:DgyrCDS7907 [Dimorphilus gyrociliatus]